MRSLLSVPTPRASWVAERQAWRLPGQQRHHVSGRRPHPAGPGVLGSWGPGPAPPRLLAARGSGSPQRPLIGVRTSRGWWRWELRSRTAGLGASRRSGSGPRGPDRPGPAPPALTRVPPRGTPAGLLKPKNNAFKPVTSRGCGWRPPLGLRRRSGGRPVPRRSRWPPASQGPSAGRAGPSFYGAEAVPGCCPQHAPRTLRPGSPPARDALAPPNALSALLSR